MCCCFIDDDSSVQSILLPNCTLLVMKVSVFILYYEKLWCTFYALPSSVYTPVGQFPTWIITLHTAVSGKVVQKKGKSVRDNAER